MELHSSEGIFFEKLSHTYLLPDGKELIGLTSLMAKHGLGANYAGIPKAKLQQAAEKGTAIHEYLQAIDEGTQIFADDLADEYLQAIHGQGLTHLASEFMVSDHEIVATFIDKVYGTGNDGEVDLADVKTTDKVHKRALAWQLGVNKWLFERLNPDIKVRKVFCVWIDKKERKLRDLVPIEPVSTEEVLALLDAERNGRIYIDENAVPELGEVLAPDKADVLAANAGKIVELENTLKILEKASEAIKAELLQYMEKNQVTEISCPGGSFRLKAAYTTTRVDSKKLQKDFPAVYQKVLKESQVKASLTFKPTNQ